MNNLAAIILAAGEGKRLKSKTPKVAHEILGKPIVRWVLDAARDAGIGKIVTVVGHQSETVIPIVSGLSEVVVQPKQLGTADAVKCAMESDALSGFDGNVVILSGDCPLIKPSTIKGLAEVCEDRHAGVVVLTMHLDDPTGYGRIIRDGSLQSEDMAGGGSGEGAVNETDTAGGSCNKAESVCRIVEQKDADEAQARIRECNSGFYCFNARELRDSLESIGSDNAQNEFYLTDALEIISRSGHIALAQESTDVTECLGINSRRQLADATAIMQQRINNALMDNGVTMISPELVWCDADVEIANDVTIYPNVFLKGHVSIGEDSVILPQTTIADSSVGRECMIGPNARVSDSTVASGCTIDESVVYESTLDDMASCGPRAYLRPGTHLCRGAKAGTHVEIKKSTVGAGSKVPHLSYIGDTTIGENVNVGAGSITCNYDGKKKNETHIGDGSFIGSDTMLVAPVSIGSNAVIGAGSTITKDIPDDSLAVARAREKIYPDWNLRH